MFTVTPSSLSADGKYDDKIRFHHHVLAFQVFVCMKPTVMCRACCGEFSKDITCLCVHSPFAHIFNSDCRVRFVYHKKSYGRNSDSLHAFYIIILYHMRHMHMIYFGYIILYNMIYMHIYVRLYAEVVNK